MDWENEEKKYFKNVADNIHTVASVACRFFLYIMYILMFAIDVRKWFFRLKLQKKKRKKITKTHHNRIVYSITVDGDRCYKTKQRFILRDILSLCFSFHFQRYKQEEE